MAIKLAEAYIELNSRMDRLDAGFKQARTKLSSFAAFATRTLAKIGIGVGLVKLIKAAGQDEASILKLRGALDFAGQGSEQLLNRLVALSGAMQDQVAIGDDVVRNAMAMAITIGKFTGPAIEEATRAAIGLAEVADIDLQTAMRAIARGGQEQFQIFTRMGIALDENASAQERLAKVLEIGNRGYAIAMQRASGLGGTFERLALKSGDVAEVVGTFLPLGPLKLATTVLKGIETLLSALPSPVRILIGSFVTYTVLLRYGWGWLKSIAATIRDVMAATRAWAANQTLMNAALARTVQQMVTIRALQPTLPVGASPKLLAAGAGATAAGSAVAGAAGGAAVAVGARGLFGKIGMFLKNFSLRFLGLEGGLKGLLGGGLKGLFKNVGKFAGKLLGKLFLPLTVLLTAFDLYGAYKDTAAQGAGSSIAGSVAAKPMGVAPFSPDLLRARAGQFTTIGGTKDKPATEQTLTKLLTVTSEQARRRSGHTNSRTADFG